MLKVTPTPIIPNVSSRPRDQTPNTPSSPPTEKNTPKSLYRPAVRWVPSIPLAQLGSQLAVPCCFDRGVVCICTPPTPPAPMVFGASIVELHPPRRFAVAFWLFRTTFLRKLELMGGVVGQSSNSDRDFPPHIPSSANFPTLPLTTLLP